MVICANPLSINPYLSNLRAVNFYQGQPHQTLMFFTLLPQTLMFFTLLPKYDNVKIYSVTGIAGDADALVRGQFGTNRMTIPRLWRRRVSRRQVTNNILQRLWKREA